MFERGSKLGLNLLHLSHVWCSRTEQTQEENHKKWANPCYKQTQNLQNHMNSIRILQNPNSQIPNTHPQINVIIDTKWKNQTQIDPSLENLSEK